MDDGVMMQRAIRLWNEAYRHHMRALGLVTGENQELACEEITRAIGLYSKSIDTCPTAEAHTFRGWAYRALGRLDEAIEECRRAIDVDPEFGNPYNDIGAYLIAKGEPDEAVEWLERAKTAPRYEPRHYPYMNLGRVFASKGMIVKAIAEFEQALRLCPQAEIQLSLEQAIERLRLTLN